MISKHVSMKEATYSPTAVAKAINNTPNATELLAMQEVAEMVFEPLREWYGKPIKVNSFFRCERLNSAVGGAKNSDHKFGRAMDIDAGSVSENKKLFDWIKTNVAFTQLIWEKGGAWVHVSYDSKNLKKQILSIK